MTEGRNHENEDNVPFLRWVPERIDQHEERIREIEFTHRLDAYRIKQLEKSHEEFRDNFNSFTGEVRAQFNNMHEDQKNSASSIHEKINILSNDIKNEIKQLAEADSMSKGVRTGLVISIPIVVVLITGIITLVSMGIFS